MEEAALWMWSSLPLGVAALVAAVGTLVLFRLEVLVRVEVLFRVLHPNRKEFESSPPSAVLPEPDRTAVLPSAVLPEPDRTAVLPEPDRMALRQKDPVQFGDDKTVSRQQQTRRAHLVLIRHGKSRQNEMQEGCAGWPKLLAKNIFARGVRDAELVNSGLRPDLIGPDRSLCSRMKIVMQRVISEARVGSRPFGVASTQDI